MDVKSTKISPIPLPIPKAEEPVIIKELSWLDNFWKVLSETKAMKFVSKIIDNPAVAGLGFVLIVGLEIILGIAFLILFFTFIGIMGPVALVIMALLIIFGIMSN